MYYFMQTNLFTLTHVHGSFSSHSCMT